jgi:hypothetical protein
MSGELIPWDLKARELRREIEREGRRRGEAGDSPPDETIAVLDVGQSNDSAPHVDIG